MQMVWQSVCAFPDENGTHNLMKVWVVRIKLN